jgi:sn-glycerol 3-phosphate transport system ATP-binding protein
MRPEHLKADPDGPVRFEVHLSEPLGANTLLHGFLTTTRESFTVSLPGVHQLPTGDTPMRLSIDPAHIHLFDPQSGKRLRVA